MSTGDPSPRFPVHLLVLASQMYYFEDFTQAEIARKLGTSRASVSRLLSEARRQGVVKIEISAPLDLDEQGLAADVAVALGLTEVYVAPGSSGGSTSGPLEAAEGSALSSALSAALVAAQLRPGDVLLTSSGRTVDTVARGALPPLPGVVVAPMLGGQDEPEPWYQTNEICRCFAERVGGRPSFLYAPALPGPELYPVLCDEPSIRRVLDLWRTARCAVVGVGAPPLTRQSIPGFVPTDALSLREAVGDVCSRFYDRDAVEVPFPGSDRLMATSLETLRDIPVVIAVATGAEKLTAIITGARGRYFNRLVTDTDTAEALLAAAAQMSASKPRTPDKRRSPVPQT